MYGLGSLAIAATDAWEVVTEVTFKANERSEKSTLKEMNELNAQGPIQIVERFTEDLYNYFPDDKEQEALIINKQTETVYILKPAIEKANVLSLEEYINYYLPQSDEINETIFANLKIHEDSSEKRLGYLVQKATYGSMIEENDLPEDFGTFTTAWFSPEIPYWFYYPEIVELPGFPLEKRMQSYFSDDGFETWHKVRRVDSIESNTVLAEPGEEFEQIVLKMDDSGTFVREQDFQKTQTIRKQQEATLAQMEEQLIESHHLDHFKNGIARVLGKERDFYINTRGERVFDEPMMELSSSGNKKEAIWMGVEEGVFGFYNADRKEWLVEPQFNYYGGDPAVDSYFKVYIDRAVGLASAEGELLVPAKYDEIRPLSELRYFAVSKDGLWGVYDAEQQAFLIDMTLNALRFCNWCMGNLLVVQAQREGQSFLQYLDTGKKIDLADYDGFNFLNGFLVLQKGERFALFNAQGHQLSDFIYENIEPLEDYRRAGEFVIVREEQHLYVMNQRGEKLLSISDVDDVFVRSEGYFLLRDGNQSGLYDFTGAERLPVEYQGIQADQVEVEKGPLKGQILKIYKDNQVGWYHPDIDLLVKPAFDEVQPRYVDEYTQVYMEVERDGKKGLYTLQGEEIITPDQYEGFYFQIPGYALVKKGANYGLLDLEKAKLVLSVNYSNIEKNKETTNYFAVSKSSESGERVRRWWHIQTEKFLKLPYDDYEPAGIEGLWLVTKKDESFLYDLANEKILAGPYEWMFFFRNGLAQVQREGLVGYIDTNGEEVFPLEYGHVEFTDEGLLHLEDTQGMNHWADPNEILQAAQDGDKQNFLPYRDVIELPDGQGFVVTEDKLFYGLLGSQGEEIFPAILDRVYVNYWNTQFPLLAKMGEHRVYVTMHGTVLPVIESKD